MNDETLVNLVEHDTRDVATFYADEMASEGSANLVIYERGGSMSNAALWLAVEEDGGQMTVNDINEKADVGDHELVADIAAEWLEAVA